jgi:hypothetical protein
MEEAQSSEIKFGSKTLHQTIYHDPLKVGTRERARKEELVEYLGELLFPQTTGFDQINLDMTFTYLKEKDLFVVDNNNIIINILHLWGLRQSEYLFRGDLATLLCSRRSRDAKSMNMFTEVTTKQEHTFKDESDQKKGFSWFGLGKKKEGST